MSSAGEQIAVYECECGSQVKVRESNWSHLRWAAGKFGYANLGEFMNANRSCCDRPRYMEVTGWDDGE